MPGVDRHGAYEGTAHWFLVVADENTLPLTSVGYGEYPRSRHRLTYVMTFKRGPPRTTPVPLFLDTITAGCDMQKTTKL